MIPEHRWIGEDLMSKTQDVVDRPGAQTGRSGRSDRVVLIGARRDARQLIRSLGGEAGSLARIVGFVDAGRSSSARRRPSSRHVPIHPQADPIPVLGRIDHLQSVLDRSGATVVLVAVSKHGAHPLLRPHLARLNRPGVSVRWITVDADEDRRASADGAPPSGPPPTAPFAASSPPAAEPEAHSSFPSWLTKPVDRARWARAAKRGSDMATALLAVAVLSPFLLIVAGLVLASSGWPIFYTQERVGQGGRLFRMFKFRSMRKDAEQSTGPIWATDQDARCTWIGAWLRKTSVDEFPQLFNVLAGDMSLVGPRPERPVFVNQFRETMPDYDLRHAVPGGMTGWAQVHGWRGRTSLRKRIQYDLDYIQRWSFGLDFRILLMTVQHVLFNKTSWQGSGRKRRGGSPRDV